MSASSKKQVQIQNRSAARDVTKRSGTTGGTSGSQGVDLIKQNNLLATGPAGASASKSNLFGNSQQTLADGSVFTINPQNLNNVYVGHVAPDASHESLLNRNNRSHGQTLLGQSRITNGKTNSIHS